MVRQRFIWLALATVLVLPGTRAEAAPFVQAALPSNAYITLNGLDWAWANPLPGPGNGFDLSFQAAFGWHIPTPQELALAPLATDFIFAGANVPFGGSDPVSGAQFQAANAALTGAAACAAPYFSNVFHHCDWQDGLGQVFGPWAGMPNAFGFAEQLAVRTAVPEPASLFLLGTGIAGVATRIRKRRRT